MSTVFETMTETARRLVPAAGEEALIEARLMLSELLAVPVGALAARGRELFPAQYSAALEGMTARRLGGEPLQYILGRWEFMGLPFAVRPCALIPRQDTETLCEYALQNAKGKSKLLDLCCGTGCIGVSLAKLGGFEVTLSDVSGECIALAKENAALNGVEAKFLQGDLEFGGRYDVICCNPPYIPSRDIPALQKEVQREPALALDGGADGLAFYRRIAGEYRAHLNDGGLLLLEVGIGQAQDVINLFGGGRAVRDICGVERVVAIS